MLPDLWKDFFNYFLKNFPDHKIIISSLSQVKPKELKEKEIVLACENGGVKSFLEKKTQFFEKQFFIFFKKKLTPRFILVEKKKKEKEAPLLTFTPSVQDLFIQAGLHPKYRFDNFAVSSTNQVAYAAAQAVAQAPGTSYNPLFIHGGVGVGKTHLAQSVARQVLEKNPEKKVLFCPGDRFTNEMIESIRSRSTERFRKKYRNLTVLIVDDVQFIAGKEAVQEEFFHTFNSIVGAGGQIILTSDRPPFQIKKLEDRLTSRFSGGLVVDIQSADFELRTAILLIKSKEKGIELDIEAAKIISERITDSRALEGALLSIYARTLGKKEKVDLEAIEEFFEEKTTKAARKISPHDIIKAVCSFYNIKQSLIKSSLRSEQVALPRQIIMFLLRRELKLKYEEIAYMIKRKDHTTVLHGENKIKSLLINNPVLKGEIDGIISTLVPST